MSLWSLLFLILFPCEFFGGFLFELTLNCALKETNGQLDKFVWLVWIHRVGSLLQLEELRSSACEVLVALDDLVSTFRAKVIVIPKNDTDWEIYIWVPETVCTLEWMRVETRMFKLPNLNHLCTTLLLRSIALHHLALVFTNSDYVGFTKSWFAKIGS